MIQPKILLVDDNPANHQVLKIILPENGYQVISAFNGEEGLLGYRFHKPDLVIIQTHLPKKAGSELAKLLREEPNGDQTPLVALSNLRRENRDKELEEIGFDAFLKKPFSPQDLLKIIEKQLGPKSQKRA